MEADSTRPRETWSDGTRDDDMECFGLPKDMHRSETNGQGKLRGNSLRFSWKISIRRVYECDCACVL